MRWFRRLIFLSLLALAGGAAAYVQSEGFSQKWRTFVIEQFEKRGIYLTLDRLTLNPMEGLVARNISVYLDKKRTVMLADVDRLNLDLDYNKMLRQEVFLEGVDLRNADLSFPIDPENPASEKLALRDINARIFLVGDRIEVSKAEGTLYGLQIHLSGSVLRPEPEAPEDEKVVEERRKRRMAAIKAQRSLIIEAAKMLRHFESAEAPRLDIQVNGDLEKPEEMSASMHLRARNLKHGNYVCEEIDAVAAYAGEQVDLSRLWVKDHLGEVEISAVWQLRGEAVDFHLRSTADLPGLAAAVFQKEELREVVFYDPPELVADGRLLLGEARPADAFVPVECVGAVSARRFVTRGEVMEGLEASFGLSPQGCYFRDVLLRHKTGTLSVQAMWQKEVGLRYKALVQLDPRIFMPFVEAKPVKDIVNRFAFTSDSGIYAEVEGEGADLKLNTCKNHGRVELHNFSYRGAAMKRASGDVEFSGFKHAYRNVDLEREEGRASAKEVACDDQARTVRLTGVVSECDPVVLTNCFAPKTAEVIARYRFDKHPHAELEGIIGLVKGNTDLHVKFRSPGTAHYVLWGDDYTVHQPVGDLRFAGANLTYDVTGDIFGEPMACKGTADLRVEVKDYTVDFRAGRFPYDVFSKPVPFTNVRANVVCKAGQVDFDSQAAMLEGRCRIKGRVDDTRKPQRYSGEIRLDAVSFNKFARIYSPKDETEGDLTGIFNFSGAMGDWRTLTGKGSLTMLNGNLYAVPILGPLTPLLGALLPRPIKGYNVAKEADCTFQVADGFASTEDIEALTSVFRLVSKGKVDFLEDRVQFEAQAKFRGLPGLVLFPVSEILEYVGEGTVGTPLWRPRYFSGSKEKTEFRKLGEKPEVVPESIPRPKEAPPVRPGMMKK